VIIYQDFNHYSDPWVMLSVEHLSDFLIPIADQDGSRLFYLDRAIPPQMLAIDLQRDLSNEDRLELIDRAIGREMKKLDRSGKLRLGRMAWLLTSSVAIRPT
jgi:hypothetical protein